MMDWCAGAGTSCRSYLYASDSPLGGTVCVTARRRRHHPRTDTDDRLRHRLTVSIHTYPTTDSRPTTQTETTRPADSRPTSDPTEPDESHERHGTATDADTDSWVARCQRQFDSQRTDRLRNCVDDENHAMPTPRDP